MLEWYKKFDDHTKSISVTLQVHICHFAKISQTLLLVSKLRRLEDNFRLISVNSTGSYVMAEMELPNPRK